MDIVLVSLTWMLLLSEMLVHVWITLVRSVFRLVITLAITFFIFSIQLIFQIIQICSSYSIFKFCFFVCTELVFLVSIPWLLPLLAKVKNTLKRSEFNDLLLTGCSFEVFVVDYCSEYYWITPCQSTS